MVTHQHIANPKIQPQVTDNITVNEPDDKYEREADQVAAQVTRMSSGDDPIQRKITPIAHIQRKCAECEEESENVVQRNPNGTSNTVTPAFQNSLSATKGGGNALDGDTQQFMESRIGADFSKVRIHTGGVASQMNRDISARAFTHGSDIYFNQNQYQPGTSGGRELLAHELTHVVQQNGPGVTRKIQRASLTSDGESFYVTGSEDSYFSFDQLVSAVIRRYHLDRRASWQLARWLNDKHGIFHSLTERRYDSRPIIIPMPRTVAFFLVDWVEPFNPNIQDESNAFRISNEAFGKAQDIWAQENVFVGFRRGAAINNAAMRTIEFSPSTLPSGDVSHHTAEEMNLLAERPAGPLPRGFFHIVVTGSTNEGNDILGKSIRTREQDRVAASDQGILLFAETYAAEGLRQVAPVGSSDPELGELIAHEIGHFLFNLTHYLPQRMEGMAVIVDEKDDLMRSGGDFDPDDHFGAESRRQIDAAIEHGDIPRPERPTTIRRKVDPSKAGEAVTGLAAANNNAPITLWSLSAGSAITRGNKTPQIQKAPVELDTSTAGMHQDLGQQYSQDTGTPYHEGIQYSPGFRKWLEANTPRIQFLPPVEVKENPLDRLKQNKPTATTKTIINGTEIDGATMGQLVGNMEAEITPSTIKSRVDSTGQLECRYDPVFKLDVGTKIYIATPPGRNGWKAKVPPAQLNNPPACAGKAEVPTVLHGDPNHKAYEKLIRDSELEHVAAIKELYERHLVPYYQFVMGLKVTGATVADCTTQLALLLGKRPQQAAFGFALGDAAETRRFDAPGSTHHGRMSVNVASGCSKVTLTSKQSNPQQGGRAPGNVRTIAPVIQAVDSAKLTVNGNDLVSDGTVIRTFSSNANALAAMGMMMVHQVTEIQRIGPFELALSNGAPPILSVAGISELGFDPALIQVSIGLPNVADWVISQVKGDQYFGITNFGVQRDQAYSAVELMRQFAVTHKVWIGPQANPELSYFLKKN